MVAWLAEIALHPKVEPWAYFAPTLEENFISACNSYVSSCLQRGKYDNVISGSFILFNSKLYPTFAVKCETVHWLAIRFRAVNKRRRGVEVT